MVRWKPRNTLRTICFCLFLTILDVPSSQIASLESELVGTKREREELEKMLHVSHEGALAQIKHLKSVDSSTIRAITTPQKKEQVRPWFGLFADCYNDEGLTRAPRTLSAWTALWRHIQSWQNITVDWRTLRLAFEVSVHRSVCLSEVVHLGLAIAVKIYSCIIYFPSIIHIPVNVISKIIIVKIWKLY